MKRHGEASVLDFRGADCEDVQGAALKRVLRTSMRADWQRTLEDAAVRERGLRAMRRAVRTLARREELRTACRAVDTAVEWLFSDLTALCEEVQATGYREASIWLAFPDTNSLEAVAGAGDTPRAFHSLRRGIPLDSALHDIVVDVMKRRRAERILGGRWDNRYDACLWREEQHERFKDRLFVPLVTFRDARGALQDVSCRWRLQESTEHSSVWSPVVDDPSLEMEVIGTLSLSSSTLLEESSAREALELSVGIAARVSGATLQGVIDRMLGTLRSVSRARSATIHFVPDGEALKYFSGDESKRRDVPHLCYVGRYDERAQRRSLAVPGVLGGPPRHDGLGVRALRNGAPQHLRGRELAAFNPGLWEDGVRGLSAYPLCSSSGESIGLVYLHQIELSEPPRIDAEVSFLVDRIGHALGQAARGARQRRKARERAAIGHVIEKFLSPDVSRFSNAQELLEVFAGRIAGFLGADGVLIRERSGCVAIAGKLPAASFRTPELAGAATSARLAREVRVFMRSNGEKLGVVSIGFGAGNTFVDLDLIRKVVDLGASALRLLQVQGRPARESALDRTICEFRRKQAQSRSTSRWKP